MAEYQSKFATKGIAPTTREFLVLKRTAAVISITAVLLAVGFGLWRATLGIPEPTQLPGTTGAE